MCKHVFPDDRQEDWGRIENQRYVHGRCSRLKTYGRPHTSLGSDAHIKAKTQRLRAEAGKRPKKKIRSSRLPQGFEADPRWPRHRSQNRKGIEKARGEVVTLRLSAISVKVRFSCNLRIRWGTYCLAMALPQARFRGAPPIGSNTWPAKSFADAATNATGPLSARKLAFKAYLKCSSCHLAVSSFGNLVSYLEISCGCVYAICYRVRRRVNLP